MSTTTSIEWTEVTWNPVTGCDRVSAGCDHCYALTLAKRLKAMGVAKYQRDGDQRTSGPGFGVTCHDAALEEPARWRRPRTVFVNSMSDLFHRDVPDGFIRRVFETMSTASLHTFQLLTKRPKRMAQLLPSWHDLEPASNVWLGVSVEDDRYVWRADYLRATPAAVRFLSLEPLIGPLPSLDLTAVDWVIVGGESGPQARKMDEEWVLDILARCEQAGTDFFFKQWGGRTSKAGGRELNGRTWNAMPERLAARTRQARLSSLSTLGQSLAPA
jgi:protein gp37